MSRDEIILGIDLGTSFSTAAAWINGRMYLVPDQRGEPCIPSVVHFGEEEILVGQAATEAGWHDPKNTVSAVKRILGRELDSPEGRVYAASCANRLDPAPNGRPIITTRAGQHTAEEIASKLYEHLRKLAELRFRKPVRRAVLTVPASASPATINATKRAARQAGLEVLDTVYEPTAAATAFGLHQYEGKRRLLVYDFGGGTFDVTIMEQNNAKMAPLATGGDGSLGGDDFDLALAQHANGLIWKKHQVQLHQDVVRWNSVLRAAETTKRALSIMEAARFRVPEAYRDAKGAKDIELTIQREDMQASFKSLIDRSLQTTAKCIMQAELRPSNIETLLLVGGTTYIPSVRASVAKMMATPGEHPGDPQTAVACGAAVAAARAVAGKAA